MYKSGEIFSYREGVGARQPLMTNSPGPPLNLQTRRRRCVCWWQCSLIYRTQDWWRWSDKNLPVRLDLAIGCLAANGRVSCKATKRLIISVVNCEIISACYVPVRQSLLNSTLICDVHKACGWQIINNLINSVDFSKIFKVEYLCCYVCVNQLIILQVIRERPIFWCVVNSDVVFRLILCVYYCVSLPGNYLQQSVF